MPIVGLISKAFPVISALVKAGLVAGLIGGLLVHAHAAQAEAPIPQPSPVAALPAAKADPRLIILDAGHGGKDHGAVRHGRREKDLALAITRKLRDRLEANGIGARLTRDDDVYVPLDRRISDSIAWDGIAFVSLHLNQDRNTRAEGIEVYAFGARKSRRAWRRRRRLPPLPAPPRAARAASADLASSIVRTLRSNGLRVDQPEKAGFYVLKNPKLPSVLIELGYLSNAREAAKLGDPEYQDELADALAASLREYLTRLDEDEGAVSAKIR